MVHRRRSAGQSEAGGPGWRRWGRPRRRGWFRGSGGQGPRRPAAAADHTGSTQAQRGHEERDGQAGGGGEAGRHTCKSPNHKIQQSWTELFVKTLWYLRALSRLQYSELTALFCVTGSGIRVETMSAVFNHCLTASKSVAVTFVFALQLVLFLSEPVKSVWLRKVKMGKPFCFCFSFSGLTLCLCLSQEEKWWPFDVSGQTVLLFLLWPFVAQGLVYLLRRAHKRSRISSWRRSAGDSQRPTSAERIDSKMTSWNGSILPHSAHLGEKFGDTHLAVLSSSGSRNPLNHYSKLIKAAHRDPGLNTCDVLLDDQS